MKTEPKWDTILYLVGGYNQTYNGVEDADKVALFYISGRTVKWFSHIGKNSLVVHQIVEHRDTIWLSGLIYQHKWKHIYIQNLCVNIHCSLM